MLIFRNFLGYFAILSIALIIIPFIHLTNIIESNYMSGTLIAKIRQDYKIGTVCMGE
jgi:hypothetical protein